MKKTLFISLAVLMQVTIIMAGNVTIETAKKAGRNFYYERVTRYYSIPYESIRIKEAYTETFNGQVLIIIIKAAIAECSGRVR